MANEGLMRDLEQRAKTGPARIAFPESGDEMILRAAEQVVARNLGSPILLGDAETVSARARALGISSNGFAYFNHADEAQRQALALTCLKKCDDLSEKTIIRKSKDPLNCAMFMVKAGLADCVAAGRQYTTGEVIIAAQTILGLAEGMSGVSSLGIVHAPGFDGPEGPMLGIADCAIAAAPDANDLADIAIASADTVRTLLGWEPRVAMLGFSTCGSAEHTSIDVIREGIEIAKSRRPGLKIDGEFQLDSALLPEIAARKVPRESEVAGRANVLVFPNLHAGNIGVKLIQLFGKADVYGPILQGFAHPVCDFSRSAPLSEMIGNLVMLVIRAQGKA